MDELKLSVRRAQRRLTAEQALATFTWSLFAALLLATVVIALPKLMVLRVDSLWWALGWVVGAVVAAAIFTIAWTWIHRRGAVDAAIEIDHRFDFKERLSSSLSLTDEERDSPAGQALVHDALRKVGGVDVRERFPVRLDRRAWLPLLPAALAFCLAMFVSDRVADNQAVATTTETQQIKKASEVLRKRVLEAKKEALQNPNLKDAEDLFKKLEEGTRDLENKKDLDRKKALVKLNDLARQLEERRENLGGDDQLKKQFERLKDFAKGPADKLAEALKEGDLKKALDELNMLKQQLEKAKLSDEDRQKLAEQMAQMQNKLREMVEAHQKAQENLQDQIRQAKNAGNTAEASKLQQQLDRLTAQMPQIDKLDQLAQKLGECSDCLKKGDGQGAAAAMSNMMADLEGMKSDLDEMEMLSDLENQIAQAKDSMNCKECNGQGCKACQGGGAGDKLGRGNGMGPGRGFGDRPEEKDKVGVRDSRVRQNVGPGRAVVTGFVDGPNVKGQVLETIQTDVEEFKQRDEDPLTQQRLPKAHREHAREYFDTVRQGE